MNRDLINDDLAICLPLLVLLLVIPSAGVLAARTGGWAKLAECYPSQSPYEGEVILCSGGMGIANYGFSLLVGGNTSGLYLSIAPWLRLGHSPLWVPWEDITAEEFQGLFYPRF